MSGRNLLFANAEENDGMPQPGFFVPSLAPQQSTLQPVVAVAPPSGATGPPPTAKLTPSLNTMAPIPSATLAPTMMPPSQGSILTPVGSFPSTPPTFQPAPPQFNPNSAFAQPYQPTKSSRYASTPGLSTTPSGSTASPHTYNPLPPVTLSSPVMNPSPVTLTPVDTNPTPFPAYTPPTNTAPPPPAKPNNYWFFLSKEADKSSKWLPLSAFDSLQLEKAFEAGSVDPIVICGGRYIADLVKGVRTPIYWTEEDEVELRRGSWYASTGYGFQPLGDEASELIEYNYNQGQFPIKFETSEGSIVMHNHYSCVLVPPGCTPDEYGVVPDGQPRPKMVKARVTEEDIGQLPHDESCDVAEALILVACGGTEGSRSVGNVDSFRNRLLEMKKAKYPLEAKVDIIPVHWHESHTHQAEGARQSLQDLTLPSVKRLRDFTNSAMMDVMFYTSPIYAQPMVESLTTQIEDMLTMYRERNPNFNGKIAFIGHGISSLILFDILSNQNDVSNQIKTDQFEPKSVSEAEFSNSGNKEITDLDGLLEKLKIESIKPKLTEEEIDIDSLMILDEADLKGLGVPLGPRKKLVQYIQAEANRPEPVVIPGVAEEIPDLTLEEGMTVNVQYNQYDSGAGTPKISYPRLSFEPFAFFGFGAPIGLLLALRGVENLGEDFNFKTCPHFLNIFHPFDPFAYRIEPYIKEGVPKPVQIPHHLGRKRLHLEIADNLGKAAAEVKAGLLRSMRSVMSTVKRAAGYDEETEQAQQIANEMFQSQARRDSESSTVSLKDEEIEIGQLNSGKRIDYQLQERPLEMINEYMFAFQSHHGYWTSEDAALLLLRQIYGKKPNIFVTND